MSFEKRKGRLFQVSSKNNSIGREGAYESELGNHRYLMMAVAAACVIAAGLGTMYFMVFFGFLQNWILIIAPAVAASVAGAFLYAGRNRTKRASEAKISERLNGSVISGDYSVEMQPAPVSEKSNIESKLPANSANSSPVTAVDKLMQEIDKKIEQHKLIVTGDAQAQAIAAVTPAEESITVVDKSKQQIAKKMDQCCIIIAAPSHGVLQDRLNNWLSGDYGRVVSTSMAINEKGFYLTVFYEPSEIQ